MNLGTALQMQGGLLQQSCTCSHKHSRNSLSSAISTDVRHCSAMAAALDHGSPMQPICQGASCKPHMASKRPDRGELSTPSPSTNLCRAAEEAMADQGYRAGQDMWGQLSQEGPESLDMWGPAGGLPDDFISMPMHSGFAAWRAMPPAPPPIPEQQPHDRPSRRCGPSWAWAPV